MNDPVGKLIAGRFRVESLLGAGGIGSVYRAIQEPLDRPVALKMLRPELSESDDIRRRFVREARAVAALSHPNIAMVHDFGVGRDSALFMAMELVDGPSLSELLASDSLSWHDVVELFDQILTGLGHAHQRGIIHRDIKPANILVARQEDGTPLVKIVDFGIAAAAGFAWSDDERATGVGQVVGTPQYMAPEQARGERHVSATVDVYATGLMLYRAVTGHDAFDGDKPMDILVAQVHDPPPPILIRPGLDAPAAVRDLIGAALQKVPRDRIPSAAAFRARLRQIAGRPQAMARPLPHPGAAPAVHGTLVEEAATVEFSALGGIEDAALGGTPEHAVAAPVLRGELPFVGREDDLARLLDVVHEARDEQRGVIVLIDAEAGAGKSRVATAARDHLIDHAGFIAAHGAFHREGERGLRGIREVIERLVTTRRGESPGGLEPALAELGIVDPDEQRTVLALLRPPVDGSPSRPASPEAIADLLLRIIDAVSASAPVVITIDDLQWAGRETDVVLDVIASELATRPARVVVICTIQVGGVSAGGADRLLQKLTGFHGDAIVRHTLRPLTDASARRLLDALLPTSPELATALVERAAGNPMHLVQLARYLAEEHLLEPAPTGWRARPEVDVSALLPPSLADIMQLRIDQLDQLAPGGRLRELLNRCAVIGRSFRFSVLERMLQVENRPDLLDTIDADIDVLLDEEFLLMSSAHHDDILTFPNSLIRDALNQRMKNRRTTRRLHAHAAEAKLAILGAEADKAADELVRHFAEARDSVRELKYARIAAHVAERTHRPHDAVTFLERALELFRDDPSLNVESESVRHDVELRVARLLAGLSEYAAADAHFAVVEAAAPAASPLRAAALIGRARVAQLVGDVGEARTRFEAALSLASTNADDEAIAASTLGLAALAWHTGDTEQAQALAETALEVASRPSAGSQLADAIWLLGDLARSRGELAEANERFEHAQALFERAQERAGVAKCEARRAVVLRAQNDLDGAEKRYVRARELYAALGDRKGVAQQLNGLGDVARFRGDAVRATELYRRAVEVFQSLRLPYDAAIALTNLGLVAIDAGRDGEAEDAFRRALVVAERIGYAYLTIGVGLNLAFVLARQGRDDDAHEVLEGSLELVDRSELVDPDYAKPLERLAELLSASGDRSEARDLLLRARSMWAGLQRSSDMERVDALLRRVHT
ncbi:MAG: tetratricopeptide repeat protein [Myxococcales bacterium]|nr:tetratricopeptide repeat protein [Myxococcales bacterium]MCB9521364.1 tetratricopeptide repeat protein [Myxococcales bacterium]